MAVSAKKDCLTCGEKIPVGAIYCSHCETYQNWRRHLQFGQTTLPMLVALVAVLGSTVPAITGVIWRPNSQVLASAFTTSEEGIDLTVSNLGARPGIVDQVRVVVESPESWVSYLPIVFEAPENPVVLAGDVRRMSLATMPRIEAEGLTFAKLINQSDHLLELKCYVIVTVLEFDGNTSDQQLPGSCFLILSGLFPELQLNFISEIISTTRRFPPGLPAPSLEEVEGNKSR